MVEEDCSLRKVNESIWCGQLGSVRLGWVFLYSLAAWTEENTFLYVADFLHVCTSGAYFSSSLRIKEKDPRESE
jgi:4-amino-4-deoxy-L-arabinose transferase-like glycosyltransferase